jgi:PAS domain S-box-containing protein
MTELVRELSGTGVPGSRAMLQAREADHAQRAKRHEPSEHSAEAVMRRLKILRALLEHSEEGTVLVGADGVICYGNPAIAQVLGYAAHELVGSSLLRLIHPEDRQAIAEMLTELMTRPGDSVSAIFRWRCDEGSWRELQATYTNQLRVPDIEAVIVRFSEVGPVTPMPQPIDLSRIREYRVLIENALHITAILERDGTIRYVSPAIERMLGLSAASLKGTNVSDLINPEDAPAAMERFAHGVQQSGPGQFSQFRARHKDGSWRLLEAITTNRLNDPFIRGLVVDARDVTERSWSAERLQHSLEALLAIHHIGRLLGSSPEQQEVGAPLLESARRIAPVDEAVLLLRNPRGRLAYSQISGNGLLWSVARRAGSARAARQHVLRTGAPQFFRVRPSDPALEPIEAWDLPLRAQERVIGILEVYGTGLLAGSGIDELSILADQAASALERSRLYRELAERERRLEGLVRQLLLAQEEERRRVAYEVHDGLAQLALAAQQHLEAFAADYRSRVRKRRDELEHALTLASRTVREARRVIGGLRPAILDDFGLAPAIAFELQVLRGEGWDVEFTDGLGSIRLQPTLERALFRVVQEALTNVRKHAQSKRVAVTLESRNQWVHLEIRDWGRGFRPAAARAGVGPSEHLGLAGMQERIALIRGRFKIRSRPGAGTRIQVQALARELEGET